MRELLQRRPFRPISIHLSNGEVYEIRHPELAILTKSQLVIAYPDSDRIVISALLHIASAEVPQVA
jgi:hypothetical protein